MDSIKAWSRAFNPIDAETPCSQAGTMRLTGGLLAAILIFSLALPGPGRAAACEIDRFTVTSADGTTIAAELAMEPSSSPVPAVIFGQPFASFSFEGCVYGGTYATLTWDHRGWGSSGGQINLGSPDHEVQDIQALIDHLATRSEIMQDGPGDPRVGILGQSYSGAIALNAAALDQRLDAAVSEAGGGLSPDNIYLNGAWKSAWIDGYWDNAQQTGGDWAPEIMQSHDLYEARKPMSAALMDWWKARSPLVYAPQNSTPTLLVTSPVDTLFPLEHAFLPFAQFTGPKKLFVTCLTSGHVPCPYPGSDSGGGYTDLVGKWFEKYLRGLDTDTGPVFEWQDQTGTYNMAASWPLPNTSLTVTRKIAAKVVSGGNGGDEGTVGGPAQTGRYATRKVIYTATEQVAIVGIPTIRVQGMMTKGWSGIFFVELADVSSSGTKTIDLQTMAIKVKGSFNKTFPLKGIAWVLEPGHQLAVEITGGSPQFRVTGPSQYATEMKAQVTVPLTAGV